MFLKDADIRKLHPTVTQLEHFDNLLDNNFQSDLRTEQTQFGMLYTHTYS